MKPVWIARFKCWSEGHRWYRFWSYGAQRDMRQCHRCGRIEELE